MKKIVDKKHQTVASLIVQTLEKNNVKHIFGVPGEEIEDLLFAISNSKIKFVPTRHEQGASFIADVWGRLTGRLGVCIATLGPGATNLLTGLADAHLDKSPVLALTGQADTKRHHKDSHQYIDVSNIFKPVSKWNAVLKDPKKTFEYINKAIDIAVAEKPGVTHLDIPEDVAEMEVLINKNLAVSKKERNNLKFDVSKIISLLKESKKPIILAGNGVARQSASGVLQKIAQSVNIPVVTTFMGKGAISDKSPLSLKAIGLKAKDTQLFALQESDLVISIGYDMGEYGPNNWATGKKIIHIDTEFTRDWKSYKPKLALVGNIKIILEEILKELNKNKLTKFSFWFRDAREKIVSDHKADVEMIDKVTVPFVLQELRRAMKDDDIIISDVGAHKMWIGRNFEVYKPNTCIISNGLASMGIALPGGIAGKLARPNVRTVAVMGDGGFLMNSQEIETAKRLGTAFVMVVLNDNDYGLISWKQNTSKGKSFGTKLSNPDFVKYAESFGIKAYGVSTKEDVYKTLKTALDSNELCLVSINIDASVNLKLSEKLAKLENIFKK